MKTVDNVISVVLIIVCSADIVLRLRDIFKKPKEPEIPCIKRNEEICDVYEISTEDDEWDIK